MTIYIDDARIRKNNRLWYHLISDVIGNEIHQFASRIGLKRSWFQDDHYDITESKRFLAVKAGAVETSTQHLVDIRKKKRSQH